MSELVDRLTLVIPTYRRAESLTRCLDGVRAQERRPDEIVLVVRTDDHATLAVVEGSGDLPIRVVAPERPGFTWALHAGMSAVSSGVAVVTDDDTIAPPDWLRRYEEAFTPGVVAVGGLNQVHVDGVPHDHVSARVGTLSYAGHLVGMHYARSGLQDVPVQHLQGCNMAFRHPVPLPDTRLRGDGVYMELDMCLSVAGRGEIRYDERIWVDHHLAGRVDEADQSTVAALAARNESDLAQVADSCFNFGYVLAKNTPGRVQRAVRLAHGLLVGQRRIWGLARVAVEMVRSPGLSWLVVLRTATTARLAGWRAGTAVRRAAR